MRLVLVGVGVAIVIVVALASASASASKKHIIMMRMIEIDDQRDTVTCLLLASKPSGCSLILI